MIRSSGRWIALDVGGANLKAAHPSGLARSLPFELWKRPDDLGRALAALLATFPPSEHLALTMTAELCDCYATKAVGVNAVLDAVHDAFGGKPVQVWGVDGRFHAVHEVRARPALAAAANWLALATLAARLVPAGPGLLIDIGTTTTDLVPLADGKVAVRGRTDTERLRTGELVYAGVRRTPLCALATELPFQGRATGLAAELFATTLDVYLTLGDIDPDPTDLTTADGRPATPDSARDRLARMIGADRDGFSAGDALAFAHAADEALMTRLTGAAERACEATVGRPRAAIVAGSGAFLARRLARRVVPPEPEGRFHGLDVAWGKVFVFDHKPIPGCASALLVLAAETFPS